MRIPATRIQNTQPVGIPSAEYTALKLLARANKSRVARSRRSRINSPLPRRPPFSPPPSLNNRSVFPYAVTPHGPDVCRLLEKNSTFVYEVARSIPADAGPENFPREKVSVYTRVSPLRREPRHLFSTGKPRISRRVAFAEAILTDSFGS